MSTINILRNVFFLAMNFSAGCKEFGVGSQLLLLTEVIDGDVIGDVSWSFERSIVDVLLGIIHVLEHRLLRHLVTLSWV
jgi:hypothetical protein